MTPPLRISCFFFFNDTATTEIYTLSLHDALPICPRLAQQRLAAQVVQLEQQVGTLVFRVHGWLHSAGDQKAMRAPASRRPRPARSLPPGRRSAAAGGGPAASAGAGAPGGACRASAPRSAPPTSGRARGG